MSNSASLTVGGCALRILTAALLLAHGIAYPVDAVPTHASPLAAAHGFTYEPMEMRFAIGAPVTASFTSPAGKTLAMPSFDDNGSKVVRFTPTETGMWRFQAVASGQVLQRGTVLVTGGRSHGFVRTHGYGLQFDDGTPFIALGENRINIYDRSWNWGTLGIEEYVAHIARNGMSVLRVFIVSDVENEERGGVNAGVLEPSVGHFDEHVAAQLDQIFRSARAHHIYVVLVAFALGFSENDDWKSWQDNPYARERGGPAATRLDFFDSPTVRAAAAGRIRYLAARYAASANLLAIDLLNEPEWDGAIPEVSWTRWAQYMAHVWTAVDPYGHPVTVGSVGLHWNIEGDERAWWASPECDIVQWHLYGKEVYEVHALATEMTRKVRETRNQGKPVLVGEFAYGGEAKPAYDHTHVGLWSAIFSGAGVLAHSAPPFNTDSDELMTPERARHFRTLRRFLQGLPALEPGDAKASNDVAAWALVGPSSKSQNTAGAVWLLAPASSYDRKTENVRVQIRALAPGRWRADWIDDISGSSLGHSIGTSVNGRLEITAPHFSRHIAARLTPLH